MRHLVERHRHRPRGAESVLGGRILRYPYYPSLLDPSSSLTIYNSSSSHFTLTAMSWVSLIIPFVLAYIVYAWYSMDRKR